MRKRKGVTIYEKQKGKGFYADFRRLGGKLEALIAKGEQRATTDIMRLEQALVSAKAELAAAERPRRQLFGYRLRDGIEKTS
jgi:hypothetical protein